ncbi:MAG: hypothetical protein V1837_06510 [Candidatus Woesearchaeota archaeon]
MDLIIPINLRDVRYSKNDKITLTKVPGKLDSNLAYFLGIHMGDGHLVKRPFEYRIEYDGHPINDLIWCKTCVVPLFRHLFRRTPKICEGHGSIKLTLNSKAIHSFMQFSCGMPVGSKSHSPPPRIILKAPMNLKIAFLRGLADTDFSVVFKNRHKLINYYPVVDYQTCNQELWDFVTSTLKILGFPVHRGQRIQQRNKSQLSSYYMQLNGVKTLSLWLSTIGFMNPNHLSRIELWKKIGHVPPGTTIQDRLLMLEKLENEERLGADSNSANSSSTVFC